MYWQLKQCLGIHVRIKDFKIKKKKHISKQQMSNKKVQENHKIFWNNNENNISNIYGAAKTGFEGQSIVLSALIGKKKIYNQLSFYLKKWKKKAH